jgi:hypothetical protein
MMLRHQLGGELSVIENGQVLEPSRTHVKMKGKRATIRIKLPLSFYEGITSLTEGMALGVVILDKKCNTTDTTVGPNNAKRPVSKSTPSGAGPPSPSSRWLQTSQAPAKEEGDIEVLGEVGTYSHPKGSTKHNLSFN